MDDLGLTTPQIRDNRYDAIIHLVSAADGAEKFYVTEDADGNIARYQTIDESKELDEQLRQAYMGHQKWFLIKNTEC